MVSACTIIARNYLAAARVLADSFFAHHRDGSFTVLVIDDERREFDGSRESFRCLRLSDIGLDRAESGQLAAIYDVTELATAVKPQLLSHLLSEGATDLVYLDPDIKIYHSLEEVSRLAHRYSIVLTPHTMASAPLDGRKINDFQILASGVYNLGFIAVGPGSEAFLAWWWKKTRREAHIEPQRMMFTDQRWVDFVPSFFDHFILKDPTYNVAYWNLHSRELTWNGSAYLVNSEALKFFHFSGFDARKPYLLSKHQGDDPRILLSERPVLAKICREYLEDLEHAGFRQTSLPSYGWNTLASGVPFDRRMRRVYREELDAHENGLAPEPPNPLEGTTDDRFLDWLNEPVAVGLRTTISRYFYAIYQDRADLQSAFPDLAGDYTRYLDWIRTDGVAQEKIPPQLLSPLSRASDNHKRTYVPSSGVTDGVNIAGYFRGEVGVGEAARQLTRALEAAGIPHSTIAYDATPSRKAHPFVERGDGGAPHDVNVVCVNADRTRQFAADAGRSFFEGRHTAGYWFWELEHFPATMHEAFDYVDEVWTATHFVASGIRAIGRRPVYTIPLPVPIPRCSPHVTKSSLGLPPRFMFLFMFDFFSILERKNPIGLIRAFEHAFPSPDGPMLVIKTINGHLKLNHLEKVRAATSARPDIFIIDGYYSAEEKDSLLGLCECYVSLHRSEGLGLTMAEAMGLEKPVIATAYSGNLDFMTADNSYLVDCVRGTVPEECDPYPRGSAWAEPNLDQAAEYMQRVYRSRDEASRKAERARQDILTKHNVDVTAALLGQRLDEIRRTREQVMIGHPTPLNSTPVPGPVEVARLGKSAYLTSLLTPTPSVPPGRPFGWLLLMAQRLLFRILRPYWWQQRQLQTLLLDDLREAMQALNSERQLRQALESLWTAVHTLESATEETDRRLRGAGDSVASFQASAASHLKALTDQLAAVTAEAGTLSSGLSVVTAQADTLSNGLAAVRAQAGTLSNRLYAAPYMEGRDLFQCTDERGRQMLGFRSKRTADGDVYVGFENIFRGSEAFIRERFRVYLPLLKAHERVVDIGCGRGELLDLLSESGVPAVGVDIDESMVRRCRAKGHTVDRADGSDYLRSQADCSLSAIFAAQLVEHLAYQELLSFLQLCRVKLKSGGQLIFETVNPHALEAFKTFWTDLTHQRPIFPEVALAWCWLLGFDQAYVFFPNGTGDLGVDRSTQGEYAVVATKGSPD